MYHQSYSAEDKATILKMQRE